MDGAPQPHNEADRLATLKSYQILDTLPEQVYDDITYLASKICETPIALISLVDADRQWFKSSVGIDASETPRNVAFCSHAILRPDEVFVVPDASRDERFSRNTLVTDEPAIRFYAGAPLKAGSGTALGTLCVIDKRPREFSDEQMKALEALSRQVMGQLDLRKTLAELQDHQGMLERYQRRLERNNEALAEESITDVLTGLPNRAAFERRLGEEFHRARSNGTDLALLLLDIDHFKAINDDFGHPTGDTVLRKVARLLGSKGRSNDLVARFGGEEFAVILPGTDLDGAGVLAERFRRAVETAAFANRALTISLGVAVLSPTIPDGHVLVELADSALYEAKRQGRNRVVKADPGVSEPPAITHTTAV